MYKNKKVTMTNVFLWFMAVISALFLICYFGMCYFGYKYPLKYQEEISLFATKYNLDSALVASVINAESNFNTNAISSKDARGLMQILPSTGDWIADEIGVTNYSTEALHDPKINIEFGCFYLAYLKTKFTDLSVILSAYNAGETTVRNWLVSEKYSKDGVQLEQIPYSQTEKYVKKVLHNLNIYSKLI